MCISLRWAPHPAIVSIMGTNNNIRALLKSYCHYYKVGGPPCTSLCFSQATSISGARRGHRFLMPCVQKCEALQRTMTSSLLSLSLSTDGCRASGVAAFKGIAESMWEFFFLDIGLTKIRSTL